MSNKKLIGVAMDGTEIYLCPYVATDLRPPTWMIMWALVDGSCGMLSLGPLDETEATVAARKMVAEPGAIMKLRAGMYD